MDMSTEVAKKFIRLEERLPPVLKQAREEIQKTEKEQEIWQKNLRNWRRFKYLLPVWILLWVGINFAFCFGGYLLSILPVIISFLLVVQVFGLILAWSKSPGPSEIYRPFKPMSGWTDDGPVIIFIWRTIATFHSLWAMGRYLQFASKEKDLSVLRDDRFWDLKQILLDVDAWDADVKLVNRLIDEVELEPEGRNNLSAVERLLTDLRADEAYVLNRIERGKRLMAEGPLGTSLSSHPSSATAFVDQIDTHHTRLHEHGKELHDLVQQIAARMEVNRI
ncbi:TPA: hypothetical protein DD617_04015 [Candidatus Uhrbacteria bacterium]|nr:hypothetical protein [Candidatus Uhrbacteria bacterium]